MRPSTCRLVPGETNETGEPNGKDFFSLPLSELYLPVSQDFHWQWGERLGCKPPCQGSSACESGQRPFHSLIFALRVEKETRRRGKSKGKKETRGERGASLNASRQNSLNARESSCRCRFSPFSPLLPPLPFLFFPLHDVCRLFHLANPAVPLHRHPISAPRESTLRTSAAVAPCPRLSPIIPRQRKTKRRRNKYSPGRKQPPGEREGLDSPTFDDVLFFPISNTLFLLPFFSLDL